MVAADKFRISYVKDKVDKSVLSLNIVNESAENRLYLEESKDNVNTNTSNRKSNREAVKHKVEKNSYAKLSYPAEWSYKAPKTDSLQYRQKDDLAARARARSQSVRDKYIIKKS